MPTWQPKCERFPDLGPQWEPFRNEIADLQAAQGGIQEAHEAKAETDEGSEPPSKRTRRPSATGTPGLPRAIQWARQAVEKAHGLLKATKEYTRERVAVYGTTKVLVEHVNVLDAKMCDLKNKASRGWDLQGFVQAALIVTSCRCSMQLAVAMDSSVACWLQTVRFVCAPLAAKPLPTQQAALLRSVRQC